MVDELPLSGGFVNAVVLKEGSVRRPVGPHTSFVHRLLLLLERQGWNGAPRVLGIDGEGREMLRFIDGHVAIEQGRSAYAESDASLTRLAVMVREFHDLTAGTDLAGDAETVCHNDLAPKNTVYADGGRGALPVAFIDWDGAAPGERLHDIAHLCWEFLRLGTPVTDVPETARRMRLVCDAYGLDADGRARLVDTVLWWQDRCRRGIEAAAAQGDPAMIRIRDLGAPAWIKEDYDWVRANRTALEADL